MDSEEIFSSGVFGSKRKCVIDSHEEMSRKRVHSSAGSSPDEGHFDIESNQGGESTPVSLLSSKTSPRYPSQLKTIQCTQENCDKTFNRPAKLAQHLRSHAGIRIFLCPHEPCAKDFLRQSHLQHHVRSAHTETRDYTCQWEACGKRFLTGTRLRRHHAAHEGREKYRCQIASCGIIFRKHGTLQKHVMAEHEGRNPFPCDKSTKSGNPCLEAFDSARRLKTHLIQAHEEARYFCTACPDSTGSTQGETTYSTYAELQAHNKLVHPPTCSRCGTHCASAKELNRHMELFHGDLELSDRKTFTCPRPDCDQAFTKKGNMAIHIKTVHDCIRAFTCGHISLSSLNGTSGWDGKNACGRGFSTKGNLEEHIRTAHMGLGHSRKGQASSSTKARTSRKQALAIYRLTGTDPPEKAQPPLSCFYADCQHQCHREHDLDMHLRTAHGLADFEIQVHRAERDGFATATAAAADSSWLLGLGAADEEADWNVQLDIGAATGGEFWLGGYPEEFGTSEERAREL